MTVSLNSILDIPDDAAFRVRQALNLAATEPLRIAYIPGPGDVYSTYGYWKQGAFDPHIPSIAYSTMFYQLCSSLEAKGLLIMRHEHDFLKTVREGAFQFDQIPYRVGNGALAYHAGRFKYGLACLKAMRAFKPHITVIASDLESHFLPLIKSSGAKLVYSLHNTFWPMGLTLGSTRQKIDTLLTKLWLRAVDSAVCTSHECARQVDTLTNHKVPTFVAVPQQIQPPQAHWKKKAPGQSSNLLYLGRIEQPKGVFDLLDSFEILQTGRPDLRLTYAGTGGALNLLKQNIEERQLSHCIKVTGHLNAETVHETLKRSGILVCPTRSDFYEGLAYVCFEAAAHGTPTIMSSVVPAQDILKGGCVVFETDSTTSLTKALESLLDDNEYYLSLSAAAHKCAKVIYERRHSWGAQLFRAFITPINR